MSDTLGPHLIPRKKNWTEWLRRIPSINVFVHHFGGVAPQEFLSLIPNAVLPKSEVDHSKMKLAKIGIPKQNWTALALVSMKTFTQSVSLILQLQLEASSDFEPPSPLRAYRSWALSLPANERQRFTNLQTELLTSIGNWQDKGRKVQRTWCGGKQAGAGLLRHTVPKMPLTLQNTPGFSALAC